MKKVIAAAAGLMLVGSMVGTASAAVSFGGDARFRTLLQSNYDMGKTKVDAETGAVSRVNEKDNKITGRVRVKVNADAKGGAYARARIRMADATWDGTAQTRNKGAGTNSYVDYAYIGMPIGPVVLEGGLMNTDLTKFFYWDRREDVMRVKWSNDMTSLQVWYAKTDEYTDPATDLVDDDDVDTYFAVLTQKFAGDFGLTVAGAYVDDQTLADMSGFTGTIQVGGPAGPVALEAALAYQEADITGAEDDGYGGYIQGGMNFGAASASLNVGFTKDGFAADDDFGFIMLGGAMGITPSSSAQLGQDGDTWWIGGTVGFKVSEDLSLKGNLVYADVDEFGKLFEISGYAQYVVSDGANIEWEIGYLNTDLDNTDDEESPFGTCLTFNVAY